MTAATANGTATVPALRSVDQFPLDRFRDGARELRRPFTAAAVRFKVQANLGPKDAPTGGLVVCYIDARLVVERLNLILPDRWSDAYEPAGTGLMWCHLTVDGITRSDVGEGQGKALVSDALKRAAVKFGVGVSLYATPHMFVKVADGHARVVPTAKGKACVLTPNGETAMRDLYAGWLDTRGVQAFGQPLDHGDTLGAQGDPDAGDAPAVEQPVPEATPVPQATADAPVPTEPLITAKQRSLLHARCSEVGLNNETRHALIHCVTGQPHSDRVPKRLLGHDGTVDGETRDGLLGVLAASKDSQITPEQLLAELRRAYAENGGPLGDGTATLIEAIPDTAIPFDE